MHTSIVFISIALFALTSATDVVKSSNLETVNLDAYNNFLREVYSTGNLSPLVASLQGPVLRSVNTNLDGLQGPSTRTFNIGPDGNIIDSVALGGFVSKDGSVLVAPSSYASYGRAVNPALVHTVVPIGIPEIRSLVYTPVYHHGFVQVPNAKSIVAGPSGTIVA